MASPKPRLLIAFVVLVIASGFVALSEDSLAGSPDVARSALVASAGRTLPVENKLLKPLAVPCGSSSTPRRQSPPQVLAFVVGNVFVFFTPAGRFHLWPAPALAAPPESEPFKSAREPRGIASRATAAFSSHPFFAAVRWRFAAVALVRFLSAFSCLGAALLYFWYQSPEQELRRAIRAGRISLMYQPIVCLRTGKITGAEALARWTKKDGTEVDPTTFVKIAEDHGFIAELTRFVVHRAIRDFTDLMRGQAAFRLSINAAAADLADPRFLPMLDAALHLAAVSPRRLTIEITERATIFEQAPLATIRALRERGYRVHIDDFGTGYSSLAYLQHLFVDGIKIDKSFTQALKAGSTVATILPQILSMAEILDLEVTVEGVETEEQVEFFRNCARPLLAQGWRFGYPMGAAELHRLLESETRIVQWPESPK